MFLPDLKDFAEFNRVYREYVGADRPARATVGARLTSPAYNVEMTFVASAATRQAIETAAQPNPNLSAGGARPATSLFVSGLLADGDAAKGDPAAQTRDILRKLDAILAKAAFARADVRDLLVYVTDEEAATIAMAECRTAFGAKRRDDAGRRSRSWRARRARRDHGATRSADEAAPDRHLVLPARRRGPVRRRPQARRAS